MAVDLGMSVDTWITAPPVIGMLIVRRSLPLVLSTLGQPLNAVLCMSNPSRHRGALPISSDKGQVIKGLEGN